jgi:hypothetical protein
LRVCSYKATGSAIHLPPTPAFCAPLPRLPWCASTVMQVCTYAYAQDAPAYTSAYRCACGEGCSQGASRQLTARKRKNREGRETEKPERQRRMGDRSTRCDKDEPQRSQRTLRCFKRCRQSLNARLLLGLAAFAACSDRPRLRTRAVRKEIQRSQAHLRHLSRLLSPLALGQPPSQA